MGDREAGCCDAWRCLLDVPSSGVLNGYVLCAWLVGC